MPLADDLLINWAKSGGIYPYEPSLVNPASIDLRLGLEWIDFEDPKHTRITPITLYPRSLGTDINNFLCKFISRGYLFRKPTAVLAVTKERITLPKEFAAEIKLKTTPTRKGLGHPVADWIDPGYSGQLTLMLHAFKEIKLRYNQPVCQIVLWPVDGNVLKPYNLSGHYMNQDKPTRAYDDGSV